MAAFRVVRDRRVPRLAGIAAAAVFGLSCGHSSPTAPSRSTSPQALGTFGTLQATDTPPVLSFARCLASIGSPTCFSSASLLRARGATAGAPVSSPLNLVVTATGGDVTLRWDAASSVVAYVIEAGSGPGLANLANFSTGNTQTSFFASGIGAGSYYVRVRSVGAGGDVSAPSNEALLVVGGSGPCVAPGSPTSLSLVSASSGTVILAWSPASGNPSSYIVEAGSSSGLSNLVTSDLGSAAPGLTANGVGDGVYYIRVRAKNACGTSGSSNEVVVTVGSAGSPCPPLTPTPSLPPPPGFPTITGVSPSCGPSGGGTPVTITGSGFLAGLTLAFSNQASPPTNVQVLSSTTITAVTPPSSLVGFAYNAGLLLTNPDGHNAFVANAFGYGGGTSPTPTPTPGPNPTPSPNNRPPVFPGNLKYEFSTTFQRDGSGRLTGGLTTVTITTPATDPDGDAITYSWQGTVGTVQSSGLMAIWTVPAVNGSLQRGSLTVTASDGRGGTATFTFTS